MSDLAIPAVVATPYASVDAATVAVDYTVPCSRCGKEIPAEDPGDDRIKQILNNHLCCPDCEAQRRAEQEADRKKNAESEAYRLLCQRIEAAMLPDNYIFDKATGKSFTSPIVRAPAVFIYEHNNANLLLSGVTGTGKSTSACYVAKYLLETTEKRIKYTTLQELIEIYVSNKRQTTTSVNNLMREIKDLQILIIDEFIENFSITKTGQDFVFRLLEAVNSGRIHTKIWILGNFFYGAIQKYYENPDPIIRRLNENFIVGIINPKTSEVEITKFSTDINN